jgi:hypothetical protein
LTRVARWYIFKPKIPIWVILEGLEMEMVGIFYGPLQPLGTFYGLLVI